MIHRLLWKSNLILVFHKHVLSNIEAEQYFDKCITGVLTSQHVPLLYQLQMVIKKNVNNVSIHISSKTDVLNALKTLSSGAMRSKGLPAEDYVEAHIWGRQQKISAAFRVSKTVAAFIILEWKEFGTTTTLCWAGHPTKLSNQGRWPWSFRWF